MTEVTDQGKDEAEVQLMSPVAQVLEAAVKTIASPLSPGVLVEDLLLVHKLVTNVRTALAGKEPSLANIFTALFHS